MSLTSSHEQNDDWGLVMGNDANKSIPVHTRKYAGLLIVLGPACQGKQSTQGDRHKGCDAQYYRFCGTCSCFDQGHRKEIDF